MFQVPSISEIEDEENAVVSAFASRHKQSGQSKSEARSVDADSSDGSHVRASNFSGRSEMTSSENALSIDYKQIVNAAPVVSEKLKKAIAASNAQNDDSVSAPSKDLFNIRENNESKVGNTLAQPPITRNYSGSTIYAINRQKGNPILKHIRNVPIEFVCDIAPDYILSEITCALFLSLRYHHLNPNYIYDRIRKVGLAFKLRLLLLEIDVIDPSQSLAELNKACFHADFTLLLAFSSQEAGRYLETYKVYQFKPVDLLRANIETDPTSRAIDFLTTIKSVSKRDAETLLLKFDTVANICAASEAQLKQCSGLGDTKAKKIHSALHQPFLKKNSRKKNEAETTDGKVVESLDEGVNG